MRETNHAVYYTTAQVKDVVELSDQNVRKYVRLLEDRKYEVAKDEHNRRLFSQEDIAVLKEFIKLAKQSGYTMETAADEIIEKVPHIVSEKEESTPASATNNDINRMLGAVMEKLDMMQHENRELKHNVNHLVERLEAYSKYNEPLSLEYRNSSEASVTAVGTEDNTSVQSETDMSEDVMSEEVVDESNNDVPEFQEMNREKDTVEEETKADEESKTSNIDMSSYEDSNDDGDTSVEAPSEQSKEKEETGGYFSKLFSIFKK